MDVEAKYKRTVKKRPLGYYQCPSPILYVSFSNYELKGQKYKVQNKKIFSPGSRKTSGHGTIPVPHSQFFYFVVTSQTFCNINKAEHDFTPTL